MTSVIVVAGVLAFLLFVFSIVAVGLMFAYLFRQLRQQQQDIAELDSTLTEVAALVMDGRRNPPFQRNGPLSAGKMS